METERTTPDLRGKYSPQGIPVVDVATASDFARAGLSAPQDHIVGTWGESGLTEYQEARRQFQETHPDATIIA